MEQIYFIHLLTKAGLEIASPRPFCDITVFPRMATSVPETSLSAPGRAVLPSVAGGNTPLVVCLPLRRIPSNLYPKTMAQGQHIV